ncbi:alpha/beta fold hydrolase [Pseudoxanthomonas sp.]|uniref:alpha/beta fold hydrolase n=1 Tax=Pseudoxanthomonas sp. TaxID=1871049 RepID=UPI002615FE5F|nr:alpha/beta fold hydrolase [Pseudoxanthomonas sp.]WDS35298.1 MAG: alpha/beta fold hydrolase [Pseudoxanthomonas sp.]
MPFLDLPTHRLHFRIDGAEGAPWLTFCNSLGTDLSMWDLQVAELAKDFRILRYDRRGHGQSTAADGLYTIDQLGGDVIALWDALQIGKTHFCGLSIGGLTGQWLGLNAAARLDKLVVCTTAAKIGNTEGWAQRITGVLESGMKPLAEGTVTRWFTEHFTSTPTKNRSRTSSTCSWRPRQKATPAAAMPWAARISARPCRRSPCRC